MARYRTGWGSGGEGEVGGRDERERAKGRRLTTEVGFFDVGVLEEVGGGVGEDDAAGLEDVAAVGDGEGHVGVLFDEEDGRALLVDLLDDLEDFANDEGGQS